jgi:hypothetical protein
MHKLNGTPSTDAQGSIALNEELFEAAGIPISTNSTAPVPATTEQKQTLSGPRWSCSGNSPPMVL